MSWGEMMSTDITQKGVNCHVCGRPFLYGDKYSMHRPRAKQSETERIVFDNQTTQEKKAMEVDEQQKYATYDDAMESATRGIQDDKTIKRITL